MKYKKKPYYQRKVFKRKIGGSAFNRKTAPKTIGLTSPQKQMSNLFTVLMTMARRGQK